MPAGFKGHIPRAGEQHAPAGEATAVRELARMQGGCPKLSSSPSGSKMSAASSAMRCTARDIPPNRWRSWCTKKPAAITSSRSSSSRR